MALKKGNRKASLLFVLLSMVSLFGHSAEDDNWTDSYIVDPVIGRRDNGTLMNIFNGFGYHGTELTSVVDFRGMTQIPVEYREIYYVNSSFFTSFRMPAYEPTCKLNKEWQEYRTKASWSTKPLQEKIINSSEKIRVRFKNSVSAFNSNIKVVEMSYDFLNLTILGTNENEFVEANRVAGLDCSEDFTGSLAQSEARRSVLSRVVCEANYPESTSSYTFDFSRGTVKNNTTGEFSNLIRTPNGGYRFDDQSVGVKEISQYSPPVYTYSYQAKGYMVINGKRLICK